jgi:DNA-binding NtrC family response regulator
MTMTNCFPRLLIVDADPFILTVLSSSLKNEFEVVTADSTEAAQGEFAHRKFDLILTSQRVPTMTGLKLLEWVRQRHPLTCRLLMTADLGIEEGEGEAINRAQISGYIFKPWKWDELLQFLREAARTSQMENGSLPRPDHLV